MIDAYDHQNNGKPSKLFQSKIFKRQKCLTFEAHSTYLMLILQSNEKLSIEGDYGIWLLCNNN